MTTSILTLPARGMALRLARWLERWAHEPELPRKPDPAALHRAQVLEAREQHRLRALADRPLL